MSLRFALRHTLAPLALSAIVVAAVLPFREVAFLLWIGLLATAYTRYQRQSQPRRAVAAMALELAIMTGVVALAVAAPGKIKDKVLERPVTLPKAELSLGELAKMTEEDFDWQRTLPARISLRIAEANAAKAVHFPAEQLSLREFIAALESQTTVRGRFGSCGNGATVLWGEDCCFGLRLDDTARDR